MTANLDPTLHPYRPDLAAASLKGRVEAPRFVEGVRRQARRGIVPVRATPGETGPQTTELLYGEVFTVFEEADGWCWGQSETDGYVGYAREEGFAGTVVPPTHRVAALRAFIYPKPDMKTPPAKAVSLGALIAVAGADGRYLQLVEDGAPAGWIHEATIRPFAARDADAAATALRFLGVPYLWGGRSSLGIDCSGLMQIALAQAGVSIDRDTRIQVRTAGSLAGESAETGLKRGDLIFFPGHVGMMLDAEAMVHATAHVMAVTVEPMRDVAMRTLKSDGRGVVAVRRIEGLYP